MSEKTSCSLIPLPRCPHWLLMCIFLSIRHTGIYTCSVPGLCPWPWDGRCVRKIRITGPLPIWTHQGETGQNWLPHDLKPRERSKRSKETNKTGMFCYTVSKRESTRGSRVSGEGGKGSEVLTGVRLMRQLKTVTGWVISAWNVGNTHCTLGMRSWPPATVLIFFFFMVLVDSQPRPRHPRGHLVVSGHVFGSDK